MYKKCVGEINIKIVIKIIAFNGYIFMIIDSGVKYVITLQL